MKILSVFVSTVLNFPLLEVGAARRMIAGWGLEGNPDPARGSEPYFNILVPQHAYLIAIFDSALSVSIAGVIPQASCGRDVFLEAEFG